jgi:1-deoxy-D-xylulose-5-phosphate reductoisomerase
MSEIKKHNTLLIPVDSEHSAIFQCLGGGKASKILLTASGGPFWGKKREELELIKPEDALKHPNWNMGAKITVDSSTMMNKGLELIEAVFLFDADPDDIQVIIHRESVIHSMVEFCDGAVIAQLGMPDMRLCIQYAATYPERSASEFQRLDFYQMSKLSFYEPDNDTSPLLELARRAIKFGGTKPAIMNGANEESVNQFLKGNIKYLDINEYVISATEDIPTVQNPTEADIFEADKAAREYVLNKIK